VLKLGECGGDIGPGPAQAMVKAASTELVRGLLREGHSSGSESGLHARHKAVPGQHGRRVRTDHHDE
jgi:hypothetical protein